MYQLPTLLHCQQRIRAVEEFDGVGHMVSRRAEVTAWLTNLLHNKIFRLTKN